MAFAMFYVTHADKDAARKVVDHLIEQKLIACANLSGIEAVYFWKSELCREGETISILKAPLRNIAAVEAEVSKIHPYEVPCIIHWTVEANRAYEQWIEDCCSPTTA